MPQHLTTSIVRNLPSPVKGARIVYDDTCTGFGVRVTPTGAKSFVLNYYTVAGRERRLTIGSFPDWDVAAARKQAQQYKRDIDVGQDPLEESQAQRAAAAVADLVERFREKHYAGLRPSTATNYDLLFDKHILPAFRHRKAAGITSDDVRELHQKISREAPYQGNRLLSVLSKLFNLAVTEWKCCTENPVKGVKRNQETKRKTYLKGTEIARLMAALATHPDRQAADIVQMLLLTGARRGEVLAARWDQFDLGEGKWKKPASLTKQKAEHEVRISGPVRALLAEIRKKALAEHRKKGKPDDPVFVFPSRLSESRHREEIKKDWAQLCKAAGITGVRIHDLRHTYASLLVSKGASLPLIGQMLGHSQPSTTARYAHLLDDAQAVAAESVADAIAGKGDTRRGGKRNGKRADNVFTLHGAR